MSDLEVTGNLIVDGTVYNKNSYCTLDTDGSTWVNALKIAGTSPNTDFHFLPDFSTQSEGTSRVFFGYASNWDSYNWMSGFYEGNPKTLMKLDSTGALYLFTPQRNSVILTAKDGMGQFPGTLNVTYGLEADDILAKGILWTTSEGIGTGGGAIFIGHNYEDGDMPLIQLTDGNYQTLWIKGSGSSPAAADWGNLELGNLTANGFISINGTSQSNKSNYAYYSSSGIPGTSSGPGNFAVSLFTDGCIFCGGEVIVYSDQRDKNLVDTLNAKTALNAVLKLNPLHFAWKHEAQKGTAAIAGLFAQEVAKAIPDAVIFYEGERYNDEYALNYNVLTTYALSAIQGLAKEVEDLRAQIQLSKAGAG